MAIGAKEVTPKINTISHTGRSKVTKTYQLSQERQMQKSNVKKFVDESGRNHQKC